MKKQKFRIIALAILSVMLLTLFAGCTSEPAATTSEAAPSGAADASAAGTETDRSDWPEYIGMASGGASSQTGIVGAIMAPILTESLGVSISSETSGGLSGNLLMVNDGTTEIGLTGTDFVYQAWNGVADWTDETTENIRTVMLLFPFVLQAYVPAESDINGFADLDGMTVNLSSAGSSTDTWSRRIFAAAGIEPTVTNVSPSDGNQQMSDDFVNASVVSGMPPHSAISEFSATNDTRLIGLDDDLFDALVAEFPYATRYTIPAGTFEFQTEDVMSMATTCMLIVNKDVNEDMVYEMTKAIYENMEALIGQHAAFEHVDANMIGMATAPLHAGAARYYEEIGIEIPEELQPIA